MKICIGRTGHEIADRVADSLVRGFGHDPDGDVFIGYGILRGMDEKFRKYKHYFNVDRGYYGASHFDGTYRISYRGTQATGDWMEGQSVLPLQPWRGFDDKKPVLVCPPTEVVRNFFNFSGWMSLPDNCVVRHKGDSSPLNFRDYNYILTFNSSVGWQGIAAGIPCVSDHRYSMVGSFFNNIPLANLAEAQYLDRERMFGCMSAMQFTLKEIEQGKAWDLIKHYTSLSAMIRERRLPPKLHPTV